MSNIRDFNIFNHSRYGNTLLKFGDTFKQEIVPKQSRFNKEINFNTKRRNVVLSLSLQKKAIIGH